MQSPISHEQILDELENQGSVRRAAKVLGISAQAISARFSRMKPDNPLKVRYEQLKGTAGRLKGWERTIKEIQDLL